MTVGRARLVLGVTAGADVETVGRAYRLAVKDAHPDRGGDAERLREVLEAHKLLKRLAETRLTMTPAPRPPQPRTLRLEITVLEALFGCERRIDAGEGRLFDLRTPAGLRPGETLRLKPAEPDGQPVLLTVTIAVESAWQVRGHDVWLSHGAGAAQLRSGAKLEIDTPRGRRALIAPEGVQDGGVVRIRGEGLPARGRHPAGDLMIRLVKADGGEQPDEARARSLLRRFTARWAA